MSHKELLSKIDVLLGGRVAEKIMFDSVTTGAGNDLMRATDIARAIVSEYGMGETLGLSTYPKQGAPVFLQSQQTFGGGREYSDETAAQLDREVKSILDQREKHVMDLLTSRKETMVKIAEKLLEKEVIYEEDFKKMI